MPVQASATAKGTFLVSKGESSLLDASASPSSPKAALPRPSGDIFAQQPIEIRLHILRLMNPTNLDLLQLLQVSHTWRSTLIAFNDKFWQERSSQLDGPTILPKGETWYSVWRVLMHQTCLSCSAPTLRVFGELCPEVPRWTVVCDNCRHSVQPGYFSIRLVRVGDKRAFAGLPRAEVDTLRSRESEKWINGRAIEYWDVAIRRLREKMVAKVTATKDERFERKGKIIMKYQTTPWLEGGKSVPWLNWGLYLTRGSPLYSPQLEKLQKILLGPLSEEDEAAAVGEFSQFMQKIRDIEVKVHEHCKASNHPYPSCICSSLNKKPAPKSMRKVWVQALLAGKMTVEEFVQKEG